MSNERTVRIAVTRAVLEDVQLWLKVRELKMAALKDDDEYGQQSLKPTHQRPVATESVGEVL